MVPLFPKAALPAGGGSGTITPTGGKNEKTKGEFIKMNSTKKNSEFGGVKKKLTAAIAMLLVATIMMVSSTYAWFTLSTAPEVTGITTSVGANGNLEMALLNNITWGDMEKISSGVGDSMKVSGDTTKSNETWGNLVDLGATVAGATENAYGLDVINLNPARLNVKVGDTGLARNGSFLMTPSYGSDGRVSTLSANTLNGKLVSTTAGFEQSDAAHGVLAIGTANSMTDTELAFRNARAAVTTNMNAAKNTAATTLNAQGGNLGAIAVQHATASAGATESYSGAQAKAVQDTLTGLQTSVNYIKAALQNAVLAYAATENTVPKISATAIEFTVNGNDAATAQITARAGETDVTVPGTMKTVIFNYNALAQKIASAVTEANNLNAAEDGTNTWEAIKTPLTYIMNTEQVKLNDWTLEQVKENKAGYVTKFQQDGGAFLTLPTGSGALADIADFAGDYNANITMQNVDVGFGAMELKANIATKTTVSPTYLQGIVTTLAGMNAHPETDTAAAKKITDTYGYVIDLAFRTNAAGSKLQLQTAAANRIYSGETKEDVMGGGSYMTFKAADPSFTNAQVIELMKAIRVVFIDGTAEGKILGVATLNTDAAETTADGIKAELTLKEYTIVDPNAAGSEGNLSIGAAKANQELVSLVQNTPTAISAIVYLDGDHVDNGDVANAVQSMTGTLNLQFSSTATLTPMDYTPLKGEKQTSEP